MIYDFDSISIESLAGKSENQLAAIAEMHPDDEVAREAMRLLREKHDQSYFWCWDCDGLVCKVSDCCLNMKLKQMSKHTPGPWQIHADATDKDNWVRRCRVVAEESGPNKVYLQICSTKDSYVGLPSKEVEANARLISAAPEMLSALEKVRMHLEHYARDSQLLDEVVRVIEKATYEPNK